MMLHAVFAEWDKECKRQKVLSFRGRMRKTVLGSQEMHLQEWEGGPTAGYQRLCKLKDKYLFWTFGYTLKIIGVSTVVDVEI